ncbi:minichromosome maintenance 10 homolog [Nomia melanderi]|uniref:minichromosome maintenance 10 homolog n=1 Tax=Nomia melanderi TaxID=2448451 RepID=UPI0013042A9B|nr:protein MCM10 homolog [Nomia melanderi]
MDSDSNLDNNPNLDLLCDLLVNSDTEENEKVPPPPLPPQPKVQTLKELDFNFLDSTSEISNKNKSVNLKNKSEVYDENLDSSDDEDRRHFEEQKYSNYGRDIKSLLKKESIKENENELAPCKANSKTFDFGAVKRSTNVNTTSNNNTIVSKDIYCDPFFGLRIVTPLVSSAELKTHMDGKVPVTVSKIKLHINLGKTESNWVIAGVLVSKSPTKTTQKGSSYSIWKISDLSENINTVCVFMFSNAHKTFWKTTVGTVIGILNPNILESKDNTDLATLSVDNPQRIMIFGKSKDLGKCRSVKKNGEPCNAIVNTSRCEFCVYHVQQEYKKCSRRAELQACSNTQKFSVDMLKNKKQQKKPLNNNNNMPEFHAVVAVKNKQLEEKDAKRLALLSGSQKILSSDTKLVDSLKCRMVESPEQDTKRSFEEISRSRGWKAAIQSQLPTEKPIQISSTLLKMNAGKLNHMEKKDLSMLSHSPSNPRLGAGCLGGTIDLSQPITKRQINVAKSNAIKWVQENGKIKAKDPNKTRLNKEEKIEKGKKRPRESESCDEHETKRPNALSDKFKEILQAKSAHTDLIEKSYEEEKEKYFNKLEMKEKMEEKMLTTYKVPCKAVRCLVCKYTSFSASEMCKEQNHPLRVTDAVKRFFKCSDCGNRTVSLDRIPSHSCIKCSNSNWIKAAMMDERKTNVHVIPLSIRGDEETYLGSGAKDANLNLLVGDKNNE